MSKAFKGAAHVAESLIHVAQRSGNGQAAQQAQAVSKLVKGLARLETQFEAEGRQVVSALHRLLKSAKAQSGAGPQQSRELSGYYVNITGRRGQGGALGRAADTGLVGRRVGRGPVRMTGSGSQSAKIASAVFSKLLVAQSQLQQIRSELEALKSSRAKR